MRLKSFISKCIMSLRCCYWLQTVCVCIWKVFIRADLWQFCLNLLSCVSEDLYCCFRHFIVLHLQTLQQRLISLS